MMRGINLFNSTQKLRDDFVIEAETSGITTNIYRTRDIIIHLKNNQPPHFFYKEHEIFIKHHVNYFHMRGKEKQLAALLALYCTFYDIPFNDPINIHHTLHVEKISQMLILHMNNIPIPESFIVNSFSYETNRDYIINNITFPIVLKFHGDRGEKVWKIKDLAALDTRLLLSETEKKVSLEQNNIPLALIQECIPNTHDFRVTIYKEEIFGVIKRTSQDGFYNNWSRGATVHPDYITQVEADLCRKAMKACGIDMAGADFVRTENGPLFFEINKSPQMNIKFSGRLAKKLFEEYFEK